MSSFGINNAVVPTTVTHNPTSPTPKMPKSNPYVSTLNSSLAKYTYIKEEGVITIYDTKNLSSDGSPELIPKYQIKVPTSSDPNVCIQDYYNNSQIYWNAFPRLNEVTTTSNNDTTTTTITSLPNNSVNKHQFLGDNLNVKNHRFSNLSTTSFDSVSSTGSACTFNSSSSSLSLNGLNSNGMDGINRLIKPTSTWEISNLSTPSTMVKYEKLLGGYVVSWNGRMFLWKIVGTLNNNSTVSHHKKNRNSFISSYSFKKNSNVFSNGSLIPGNDDGKQSELYCVEGLSGLGARVAEFERNTNMLYINVSNKILDADSYSTSKSNNSKEEELLTSFESFILVTGLIAKNSARKLSKRIQENPNDKYTEPHLFNYSPFFMFCGFCS